VAGGVDACDAVVQVADAIEAWTEADLDRAALLAPQTKEKE
jgi:hypothetical protein